MNPTPSAPLRPHYAAALPAARAEFEALVAAGKALATHRHQLVHQIAISMAFDAVTRVKVTAEKRRAA